MSETMPPAPAVPAPAAAPEPPHPTMPTTREAPKDVDPARAAKVQRILADIVAAKRHWEADYKRMTWSADFASGLQHASQTDYDDARYRVNLVGRHIRQRVAALYAKNPKAVYKRKPRMDFKLWDERPETLQLAQQALQTAMQINQAHGTGDPEAQQAVAPMGAAVNTMLPMAQALLADFQQGMERRMRADKIGRTLELLWDYWVSEQTPSIKGQMKAMVRRTLTTGVGYMKLGFQRVMVPRPDNASRYADLTDQLARIERLRADMADKPGSEMDVMAEDLRQSLIALQSEPEMILREGPVLDFPRATAVIPDPRTRSLKGWVGTGWIAEEFELPSSKVQEIYGVDLCGATVDRLDERSSPQQLAAALAPQDNKTDRVVRFWQFYELASARLYTVAEGWPDYLEEPRAPEVKLEKFFPYYALSFNDLEHEKRIFPPSEVELLRSPQEEFNRTKESLRQHRIANRPLYATYNGALEDKDAKNLATYGDHALIAFNNLKEGQSVGEMLQPVAKIPIDPNVYDTEAVFSDILRAAGSQEANLGGTSGATATETSVAEASRMSSTGSDTDEMDDLLTELARDFGIVCLSELDAEKVTEIIGPGAVWPTLSRSEIIAELQLTVEAGSSGRPNRDRDLANFERIAPYLMQLPGMKPDPLVKYALKLLDDKMDVNDFLQPGAPSVTALNSMTKTGPAAAQPGTGNPATDPAAQGPQGAHNAPATDKTAPGPQPAYGPSGNNVG